MADELNSKEAIFSPLSAVPTDLAADYPSAEDVIKKLQSIQKQYPKLITLIEIGKSVEGRQLMFAKITAPESTGRLKVASRPEFKYVANMHGDEIVGRELMVKLIEDLTKNYGKDNRITKLLDSVQIYIMPSLNPDGATKKVRANANGIDLNRSFPDFTTADNQNTLGKREPEILAMMNFQAQHQFLLSANFFRDDGICLGFFIKVILFYNLKFA